MNKYKGFTLIELLVVIAIIGLFITLSIVALNSVRSKARDVKRLEDARQIITALQMYNIDNGKYPYFIAASFPGAHGYLNLYQDWLLLEQELAPYIDGLPRDPISDGPFYYFYHGFGYPGPIFEFRLEKKNPNSSPYRSRPGYQDKWEYFEVFTYL